MNNVFAPVDALTLPASVCFAPLFLIETHKTLFAHRKNNNKIELFYRPDDPILRLSPDIKEKNEKVFKWIRENIQDEHVLDHPNRLYKSQSDWIEYTLNRARDVKGYDDILNAEGGDYMRVLNMLNVLRTHDPEKYDSMSIYHIFKRDLPFTKYFASVYHLNQLAEHLADNDIFILPYSERFYGLENNSIGRPNTLSSYIRQKVFNPLSRECGFSCVDVVISPYFGHTHKYPQMKTSLREINFKYLDAFDAIAIDEPFTDLIDEHELAIVNIDMIKNLLYDDIVMERENPNFGETNHENEDEEIEFRAMPFMRSMKLIQDALVNYIQTSYKLHLYYQYETYMKLFKSCYCDDMFNKYYIDYLEISKIYQNKIRMIKYITSDLIADAVLSYADDFYRHFDDVGDVPHDNDIADHLFNWLDEDLFVRVKGYFIAIQEITGGDIFKIDASYIVGEFDYEVLLEVNLNRLQKINIETQETYMRLHRRKPHLITYTRHLNDLVFKERNSYLYHIFGSQNQELIKFYKENSYDDLVSTKFKNWSSRHYCLSPELMYEYNHNSVRFYANGCETRYDSYDMFYKVPHAIDAVIKMIDEKEFNVLSLIQGVCRSYKLLSSFRNLDKDKARRSFYMRRFIVSLQDEEFKRDVKLRLIRNRLNHMTPALKWLKSVYDELVINGLFTCPICYELLYDNDDVVGFRCSRCSCVLCQGCVSTLAANPNASCPLCRLPLHNW